MKCLPCCHGWCVLHHKLRITEREEFFPGCIFPTGLRTADFWRSRAGSGRLAKKLIKIQFRLKARQSLRVSSSLSLHQLQHCFLSTLYLQTWSVSLSVNASLAFHSSGRSLLSSETVRTNPNTFFFFLALSDISHHTHSHKVTQLWIPVDKILEICLLNPEQCTCVCVRVCASDSEWSGVACLHPSLLAGNVSTGLCLALIHVYCMLVCTSHHYETPQWIHTVPANHTHAHTHRFSYALPPHHAVVIG